MNQEINGSTKLDIQLQSIEKQLDLSDITVRHGLYSFRYGTSNFLNQIFDFLKLGEKDIFYDLGSGYGLVLHYGALKFPKTLFKGIEILKERYDFSLSLMKQEQLTNVEIFNSDILNHDFSDGNYFYIFNPLFGFQYSELVNKLKDVAREKVITVIAESKCDVFDQENWLQCYHSLNIDVLRKIQFYKSTIHLG